MNEYRILKDKKIYLIGLIIFTIISIMMQSVSYVFGYLLGYCINMATFLLIIQSSKILLDLKNNTGLMVTFLFLCKLSLYALGFYVAVKLPNLFHMIGVFFGYLVIKVTIYVEQFIFKGGESDE